MVEGAQVGDGMNVVVVIVKVAALFIWLCGSGPHPSAEGRGTGTLSSMVEGDVGRRCGGGGGGVEGRMNQHQQLMFN